MPFNISFYQDQVMADGAPPGATSTADPNRQRARWVLHIDEPFTVPDSDR